MMALLLAVVAALPPPPAVEPASVIQLPIDLKVLLQTGIGGMMAWLLKKQASTSAGQAKFKEETDKQLAGVARDLANVTKSVDRLVALQDRKPAP